MTELERLRAERDAAIADRDHLKDRERSIIEACERVTDGGQYRADIVSAIENIRRQRDDARTVLRCLVTAGFDGDPALRALVEQAREALK